MLESTPDFCALEIPGHPRPKQGFRWYAGRAVPPTQANPLTRAWAQAVFNQASAARLAGAGFLGAFQISAVFRFGTGDRLRHGRAHLIRPDVDNLLKLVLDELARAGLVGDDKRASVGELSKVWVSVATEGARVFLRGAPGHGAGKEKPPAWLAGGLVDS